MDPIIAELLAQAARVAISELDDYLAGKLTDEEARRLLERRWDRNADSLQAAYDRRQARKARSDWPTE